MAAKRACIPQRSGFLSAFYGLVPHCTGCMWQRDAFGSMVLGIQLRVMGMTDLVISRVVRLALFWHFLDLIWIGIITIVYFGGLTYG